MKKRVGQICLAVAAFILLSALMMIFLPSDHCCEFHESCNVCLLISIMERLHLNVWLAAFMVALFGYLHICENIFAYIREHIGYFRNTPVELRVKLSN